MLFSTQFYAVSLDTNSNYDNSQHLDNKDEDTDSHDKWKEVFELILYPALKKRLLPQKRENDKDQLFIKVTSLPELYKVFERC